MTTEPYTPPDTRAVEFNMANYVGTPVWFWPMERSGPGRPAVTESHAWQMPSGTPVVLVSQYSGGIALTHIEVMEPKAPSEVVELLHRDETLMEGIIRASVLLTEETRQIAALRSGETSTDARFRFSVARGWRATLARHAHRGNQVCRFEPSSGWPCKDVREIARQAEDYLAVPL